MHSQSTQCSSNRSRLKVRKDVPLCSLCCDSPVVTSMMLIGGSGPPFLASGSRSLTRGLPCLSKRAILSPIFSSSSLVLTIFLFPQVVAFRHTRHDLPSYLGRFEAVASGSNTAIAISIPYSAVPQLCGQNCQGARYGRIDHRGDSETMVEKSRRLCGTG